MNRLAGTDLLADAMPFATLDPTTRKIDLPDGYSLFLTDTVGFIRNLPTSLVAAFRSTLEEVTFSDFIIHVVDVSHEGWELQHEAVMETLAELGAAEKPVLTVLNKVDLLVDPNDAFSKREAAEYLTGILDQIPNSVAISAFTGEGVPEFLRAVLRQVQDLLGFVKALVPYSESGLVQDCYDYGRVLVADYREDGIYVEAELVSEMRSKLDRYKVCD